jgi:hypothetical protein
MKELCLAQSGLEIRAGSSGDEHRKIPHLAEKEMVGTRRLELLTSTVSTVRVPLLGATCNYPPELPSSSKYVQDGPTTGWNTGWEC